MKRRYLTLSFLLLGLCLVITPLTFVDKGVPEADPLDPCQQIKHISPQYQVGTGERLIFAVARDYGETSAVLSSCVRGALGYTLEWQAAAFTGSAGFARPGPVDLNTLLTPTGSFTMSEAFGRTDPGTALRYHRLRPDSWWSGSRGQGFNHYFRGTGTSRDEHLWSYMLEGDYEQAVVINFNRPPDSPAVFGQSYAIFLHAGLSESWGCISTDLESVIRVQQAARPGDRIIMGVEHEIFPTGDTPA